MERRVLAAVAVVGFGLVLVLVRLIQLTVVEHEQFAQRAENQHRKRITWTPRRGTIIDRNGIPLALSVAAESLFVRPSRLPQDLQNQHDLQGHEKKREHKLHRFGVIRRARHADVCDHKLETEIKKCKQTQPEHHA